MNSFRVILILILISGLSIGESIAQTTVNDTSILQTEKRILKEYTTIRLNTQKPVIDGILDDKCWETGEWAGEFIQFVPAEGGIPTFPTEFKVLYDDKFIYKEIRVETPDFQGEYEERVRAFSISDFEEMFVRARLQPFACWGDYRRGPFDPPHSERLVIFAHAF